ncbi:MAG: hypothetical protein ACOYXW_15985 [Actinomycetota bacterium]
MSSFRWQFEDADGQVVEPAAGQPASGFPTQADAETWIGETWRDLLDAGVEQVRLVSGADEVYGPMSLRPVE